MARRATGAAESTRRMPRAQRREQILDAATRAFARGGHSATSLDDVAAEAGISRVILYRHFDSKTDLYRAVLDRASARLTEAVGEDDFDETSIPALLRAASEDPDGFRLLFRHAARELEFRDITDSIRIASTEIAERHLSGTIPDGPWQDWAARLVPTVALEAVIAWLDAGQPDPDDAADRVSQAIDAVVQAARPHA
ncbi:TetR family transcriptional regulator [Saccharopolyspora sp. WRP15-2]|uniref:TetR family transcriptional regulator n=1 Tax=Saccharopolyspora oryzae TaxID=2997343 RepID=A0ABT4UV99_9PSEU|nr:TetR family transcriptional regulator [Saccharopolyspora oryzae]MDA3625649.1 TetR family transcriptional regulator [Saccharopolyspora oryzae]